MSFRPSCSKRRFPPLKLNLRRLGSCQTYEGGFASASFPSSNPSICPASAEAHGGYTSCAVFSWFLLQPLLRRSEKVQDRQASSIDVDAVLRWGVMQQSYAVEGGGFRGRTNKLVDGCYGWWVGGLFAVLDSVVQGEEQAEEAVVAEPDVTATGTSTSGTQIQDGDKGEGKTKGDYVLGDGGEWEEVQGRDMLFNRTALQEYILIAAQSDKGGLRDKPGK